MGKQMPEGRRRGGLAEGIGREGGDKSRRRHKGRPPKRGLKKLAGPVVGCLCFTGPNFKFIAPFHSLSVSAADALPYPSGGGGGNLRHFLVPINFFVLSRLTNTIFRSNAKSECVMSEIANGLRPKNCQNIRHQCPQIFDEVWDWVLILVETGNNGFTLRNGAGIFQKKKYFVNDSKLQKEKSKRKTINRWIKYGQIAMSHLSKLK